MYKITKVIGREILDSRGNPTVEATVYCKNKFSTAMVPSGASTGKYEAVELRDNEKNRYHGKGVQKAVHNIHLIGQKLKGFDIREQSNIDNFMIDYDGTHDKSKLGANSILAVSLACARLRSLVEDKPLYSYFGNEKRLPVPFFNIINGGKHADNKLSFQEFMIAPVKAKNFEQALRIGSEVYHQLKKDLRKKYGKGSTNIGDEGGFAPNKLQKVYQPLKIIMKSVKELGYEKKVKIAIDSAASEFYNHKMYKVDGWWLKPHKLVKLYEHLVEQYPIISIEDPFDQEDYLNWRELKDRIGNKVQIVGDDLLVTNVENIDFAKKYDLCNALLLKLNQIGTLTESLSAAKLAYKDNWNIMVSHRSGETIDPFISDFVVGLGCGQIKSGAPCRGERIAKYNRLLRIEQELGKKSIYTFK
tara:strand:+ start:2901 stop:4148 length:1248 start_codon:yes stop_codon:yes gene_type:complete